MKKKEQQKLNKHLRVGDVVVAITGNDKGRAGKILSRQENRVVVQGLNVRKKHMRRTQENPQGGVVEIERSMHISNVQLCAGEDKPVKMRVRVNKGERELYYLDGGKEQLHRPVKKAK